MFNSIPEILEDLKKGRMVIVADDEDRENEGDLIMAASFIRPEDINFMAKYGRGLVCVPMEEERLKELGLEPMLRESQRQDPFQTGWMISVDAAKGISTGISAHDRSRTIEVLINPQTKAEDLIRPGHIFPLRCRKGGVLVRAGHTEATIDFMKLAGMYPAGVICEIMNDDGTMARLAQLIDFSKQHNLKICSIANLIEYRRRSEKLIERISQTILPTESGEYNLILYRDLTNNKIHTVLFMGKADEKEMLVRVHSECLTGDTFGSLRCDCGKQLKKAMQIIAQDKKGVILYMNQEGRGIGLVDKIKAYSLQEQGLDTVEANEALGHAADLRDYGIGAQILVDLGIKKIRLLTNNPRKIVGLEGYGLEVVERVPLETGSNPLNYKYLKTKKEKIGAPTKNIKRRNKMVKIVEGNLIAKGKKFGIVASRFNDFVTKELIAGCTDALLRHGASEKDLLVTWVPGAFEIPLIAQKLAKSKAYDAIICLGTVIRGATPHFDYIAAEVSKGIAKVSQDTGIPVAFGVITADTIEQAVERAGTKDGNKGRDAAVSAIEMANLLTQL